MFDEILKTIERERRHMAKEASAFELKLMYRYFGMVFFFSTKKYAWLHQRPMIGFYEKDELPMKLPIVHIEEANRKDKELLFDTNGMLRQKTISGKELDPNLPALNRRDSCRKI
mgnify:CR=1 FL=1|jgi:hypothetical protein